VIPQLILNYNELRRTAAWWTTCVLRESDGKEGTKTSGEESY